ncbi:MAG: hypothetical protein P1U56_20060 [Saprospiraceae bacterium]|nr:hypothetical protein [Saprospiraceae bacterium]
MKQGKHMLKKQKGGYGFFGEIELEVEISIETSIEFRTNIDHLKHSKQYDNSVEYGLNYAINRIKKHENNSQNYLVRVLSVFTFPVDSSPTVLSFVAAKALFNAFNFDSEYPKLGEENGEILFTK